MEYNQQHGIVPETVFKTREEILQATQFADSKAAEEVESLLPDFFEAMTTEDKVAFLTQQMEGAAKDLEFERAADLRDQIKKLKDDAKRKKVRR